MEKLIIEIGNTYKSRDGRLIKILDGKPPINGKCEGWDGIYFGDSVDDKQPALTHERYTFEGKWWSYFSGFSMFGYKELSNPNMDLIELGE